MDGEGRRDETDGKDERVDEEGWKKLGKRRREVISYAEEEEEDVTKEERDLLERKVEDGPEKMLKKDKEHLKDEESRDLGKD